MLLFHLFILALPSTIAATLDIMDVTEIPFADISIRNEISGSKEIIYDEALFKKAGQATVPFDPAKYYYLAFFNDMSHTLIYGFSEGTHDPFFSKQASCPELSKEPLSEKRKRYFNAAGGKMSELLMIPYKFEELAKYPRYHTIYMSFEKLLGSPWLSNSSPKTQCGHGSLPAKGDMKFHTTTHELEVECGAFIIALEFPLKSGS